MYQYPESMTLSDARKKQIVKWIDPIREDFHVVVFQEGNTYIFAPQYPTSRLVIDCLTDAMTYGRKLIKDGNCCQFNVTQVDTGVWPHIKLEVM
jgi:hypothetical protein